MTTKYPALFYIIAAAYVVLAALYSIVTPIFEASDELWHYPTVKFIADNHFALPQPDPAQPWRQQGGQPPLYYMLAALLTRGIDTSDMDTVRRINPHADIGVVRPDGNVNMIVHRPDAESFPWRGTTLAVQVARFFSVALGLGTVIVTYQLAREIFPQWPTVALGAMALTAFLPMFLFISGSVNNDNLSNLLGNLLTLLLVKLLKVTESPHWRVYAIIGAVTGAGLLAKLSLGFMIPLVALSLGIVSVRLRDWRPFVVGGVVSGALTIAIAGWWYWRNFQLYDDPTGLNAFLDTVGRRLVPANWQQIWAERHSFTQAYWGFFGGVNVPLPDAVYLIFNIIGGVGLVSAAVFLMVMATRRFTPHPRPLAHKWRGETIAWLPAAITLIWPVVTFISYLRWTAETPASQGRLMFGALSSLSLWMAVGLVWWLPRRLSTVTLWVVALYFVTVSTGGLLLLDTTYAVSASTANNASAAESLARYREPGDTSGGIYLTDAAVETVMVYPDQYVHLDTGWRLIEPVGRDWSLFTHLTTEDDVIVAQRDVYPYSGLVATSDLGAGQGWRNHIAVRVPPGAYAPQTLTVKVGWYHLPTGERMTLPNGNATYTVGQVELLPRESDLDVPNPVAINFGNEIELVGYDLSDLTPAAGDDVTLTLYWRALRPLDVNYTVFAHIIDPRSFTIYAGKDSWPADSPTGAWQPGDIIEDVRVMTVREDTPPDIYELEVGLYTQEPDGSFPRLRIVTADGGMADNWIYLSRVRVLPAGE